MRRRRELNPGPQSPQASTPPPLPKLVQSLHPASGKRFRLRQRKDGVRDQSVGQVQRGGQEGRKEQGREEEELEEEEEKLWTGEEVRVNFDFPGPG